MQHRENIVKKSSSFGTSLREFFKKLNIFDTAQGMHFIRQIFDNHNASIQLVSQNVQKHVSTK